MRKMFETGSTSAVLYNAEHPVAQKMQYLHLNKDNLYVFFNPCKNQIFTRISKNVLFQIHPK